jgi:hypothetical protein
MLWEAIMSELAHAPEAFKEVIAEYCPREARTAPERPVDDEWTLGPVPQYLACVFKFESLLLPPDIEALKAKAPELARSCGERAGWYDMLLAIVGEIVRHPELRNELIELFHLISELAPYYDSDKSTVYPRERNEELLEEAIADADERLASGRPIRTTASLLFDAANDNEVGDTTDATDNGPPSGGQQGAFRQGAFGADENKNKPLPGASYGASVANGLYKRKPIFGAFLYKGEITILSGPGGMAKSTWASAIAVSLATGQGFFGFRVAQRPVLYINLEDALGEVALRINAIEKHHKLSRNDIDSNLYLIGAEDAHLSELVESDGRGGNRIREAGFKELTRVVKHCGAELVILDPLVLLLSGGQNDGNLVGQVMRKLKAMAIELGFALMLIAHTRKGANALTDGADATAGSGALTNLARVGLGTVSIDERRAQALGILPGDERHYREVVNTKANLAPIQNGVFFELVSVGMGNSTPEYPDEDKVAVAVPYTPPSPGTSIFSTQLLRDVAVKIAQGIKINGAVQPLTPDSRGPRAHHTACASTVAHHYPDKSQKELEAIAKGVVAELLKKGWVESVDVTVPKSSGGTNTAKGLQVCWPMTPFHADAQPGPFCTN